MRLIDAEQLLEDLNKWDGLDKSTLGAVEETIEKQSTAYNVDKVVNKVEKQLEIYSKYYGDNWREEEPLVKAVKIIKEG